MCVCGGGRLGGAGVIWQDRWVNYDRWRHMHKYHFKTAAECHMHDQEWMNATRKTPYKVAFVTPSAPGRGPGNIGMVVLGGSGGGFAGRAVELVNRPPVNRPPVHHSSTGLR